MTVQSCPCGSQRGYAACCQPAHNDHASVDHPEKLMRARYAAHVLGLVDFVVDTYHPSCEAEQHRKGIADSINSDWLGLQVLSSNIDSSGKQGFVEFKAHYADDVQEYCLHEKSRFLCELIEGKNLWFYIDGVFPGNLKAGRNDPCPCGSGKKFKKCCG
ncbi:hypothetical protein CS022_00885 [Veronia nyctiphanis]|uniref:YchJ-like middle NTF2-like domain-containing protein n=1 Tax=Veronia nyctiphanis TaxID=1278244 RepID=A0A4Q0YU81_9GAMM|nr:YchJ family metal-binding protein [Veronia nyctiphanis]RXJ74810.1 hypothetical protein CS022_00885 [Veronia nyctiphanis]